MRTRTHGRSPSSPTIRTVRAKTEKANDLFLSRCECKSMRQNDQTEDAVNFQMPFHGFPDDYCNELERERETRGGRKRFSVSVTKTLNLNVYRQSRVLLSFFVDIAAADGVVCFGFLSSQTETPTSNNFPSFFSSFCCSCIQ